MCPLSNVHSVNQRRPNKNSRNNYIDFATAFDTVIHQKLLYKLQSYGIPGNRFERLQCTKVGDVLSQ